MGDIRDLGPTGQAVYANAERLQKANKIDQKQFDELTNDDVGPQDVAIGNAALEKLMNVKADDREGVSLFMSIPRMNSRILELQNQARQERTAGASNAASGGEGVGAAVRAFMGHVGRLDGPSRIAENIR